MTDDKVIVGSTKYAFDIWYEMKSKK